jgi:hypothetical protein
MYGDPGMGTEREGQFVRSPCLVPFGALIGRENGHYFRFAEADVERPK